MVNTRIVMFTQIDSCGDFILPVIDIFTYIRLDDNVTRSLKKAFMINHKSLPLNNNNANRLTHLILSHFQSIIYQLTTCATAGQSRFVLFNRILIQMQLVNTVACYFDRLHYICYENIVVILLAVDIDDVVKQFSSIFVLLLS